MKQKVVIKVSMNDHKSRSKALKVAVGVPGVESAALKGKEMNEVEVIGEGIDAAELTTLLRKKIGHAVLETVETVEEKKKEEKKKAEDTKIMQMEWPLYYYPDVGHVVRDPYYYDQTCSIM